MTQTLEPTTVQAARPPGHRGRRRTTAALATAAALAAAVVHLAVSAPAGTGELAPYGLVHSVPPTFYASVAASLAAVVVLLAAPREHRWLLGVNVAVLAVVLHGTAAVLEGWARFPTAWLHAGYTESVMSTQDVATELGARFSWPAFFTAAAAVFAGSADGVPEPVLRWAPVFFQLACLAPFHVIASRLCPSWRTAWLAVVFFGFTNWVGQDYFAPQAGAILLGLCILATVFRSLVGEPRPLRLPGKPGGGEAGADAADAGQASAGRAAQGTGPARGEAAPATGPTGQRVRPRTPHSTPQEQVAAILLIALLAAALAACHQLTPFVLAMQLGALWAVRRLRSLMLPVLVGLMALLWTSWGAVDFWISHLDDIFGRIGDPGAVLGSSVGGTVQASPEHSQVLALRMLYAGLLGAGALAGIVLAARRARGLDLTVPALAAAPAALVFLQDYGGEVVLRVFLYATPFLAILLAQAFVPGTQLRRTSAVVLVAVLTLASPLFLVAKYGNESFERVTPDDVALGACLYAAAPPGTAVYAASPHLAWQFTDVAEHVHVSVNEKALDTPDAAALAQQLPADTDSYVLLTRSQATYVERAFGVPEGWGARFARGLSADPRFTEICTNDAGSAYRFSPAEG